MLKRESKAIMKIEQFLVYLVFFMATIACKTETNKETTKLTGNAFGTTFNITYLDKNDYTKQIDSLFHLVNKSLSTYIPNSDISKINNGDTTINVDAYFKEVFNKSNKIYKETAGVFDPTIGTLVNAWGFGPEKTVVKLDSQIVRKLLTQVGFDKVHLVEGKIKKMNPEIYFDFNAIAKGYAVDVAGRFLETQNISSYLVEIGGEIRTKGLKIDGSGWKVGVEEPNFDGTKSIQKVLELKNVAMATSGNYRKFKIDSITGKKYAHILNPKTGYPTQNTLLSVSVIGKIDCADADGYATALMAMDLIKAKQFLKKHQELRAYIIFSDISGNLKTYQTPNF